MKKGIVTIALHTGKKDYYPLIENFLKSLLLCVDYPQIEIMLIESAGNKEIREWFEKINFDDCFVNFSGVKTSVKKNKGVNITKTVKFYDYPVDYEWFQCYTHSIQRAINDCIGKYFCFFAEDNQFTVKGDIISDYIKIINKENNGKSFVHFFAQQKYKLLKGNNYFDKTPTTIDTIEYFKPKHKWDFWSLTLTKNYKDIGPLESSTKEKPHNTISEYIERTRSLGYARVYPKLPHGVWFHNSDRNTIINAIKSNSDNPDYTHYKIFDKSKIMDYIKNFDQPVSSDDFNLFK